MKERKEECEMQAWKKVIIRLFIHSFIHSLTHIIVQSENDNINNK